MTWSSTVHWIILVSFQGGLLQDFAKTIIVIAAQGLSVCKFFCLITFLIELLLKSVTLHTACYIFNLGGFPDYV